MASPGCELQVITFAKDLCSYVMQASLKVFKFFLLCEALEQSAESMLAHLAHGHAWNFAERLRSKVWLRCLHRRSF